MENISFIYLDSCSNCSELTEIEIGDSCAKKLLEGGEQGNNDLNHSLMCKNCLEFISYALCDSCIEEIPERIILDVEFRNHLEKDCQGDIKKLKFGLVGIKQIDKEYYLFYDETEIEKIKRVLYNTSFIVGYNLIGHNGMDYRVLENYGINMDIINSKSYDIMTLLIRLFGSYKNFSLDNITKSTFSIPKKKKKTANYKLFQNGNIEAVTSNLKHELHLIERVFTVIMNNGELKFETPSGMIDSKEINDEYAGLFPEYNEEIIDPYDFPLAGFRMEIKDRVNEEVTCHHCNKNWLIKSVCYYGDTTYRKVNCPNCDKYLIEVKTNTYGEDIIVEEINHSKNNTDGSEDFDNVSIIWNNAKKILSLNQIQQTMSIFNITGTQKVCWICGDKTDINFVETVNSENKIVSVIHCNDCIVIQKEKGAKYRLIRPLK